MTAVATAAPTESAAPAASLRELARTPRILDILVRQARRGVAVQQVLRTTLLVYVAFTVFLFPPGDRTAVCGVLTGAYLAFTLLVFILSRNLSDRVVRLMWTTFAVDLVALTAVTALAATAQPAGWTTAVLLDGFFVLPLLAATQLRPWVAAVMTAAATAAALFCSALYNSPEAGPWENAALHTMLLLAIGAGAFQLSRIQRFRVLTIGGLADQRRRLLQECAVIEGREREDLAVHLHDGALQYVLAAAQDLQALATLPDDERREANAKELLSRVTLAVSETAVLLRSSVSDLHPRVLDELGLGRALEDLAATAARRGGFAAVVDTQSWPSGRTDLDTLLFATAGELLTNVVKHARAHNVEVTLRLVSDARFPDEPLAELTVADDGVGLSDAARSASLAGGHIGLHARETRLEAASGRLAVTSPPGGGCVAVATVPMPDEVLAVPAA